jgi:hypothetical protein
MTKHSAYPCIYTAEKRDHIYITGARPAEYEYARRNSILAPAKYRVIYTWYLIFTLICFIPNFTIILLVIFIKLNNSYFSC